MHQGLYDILTDKDLKTLAYCFFLTVLKVRKLLHKQPLEDFASSHHFTST